MSGLKIVFLITLILCVVNISSAQNKEDKEKKAKKEEKFLHNSMIFNKYDNWFTVGVGAGINAKFDQRESNINAAFHYKVWKIYMQTGYHRCSDEFIYDYKLHKSLSLQVLNNIYLGAGIRSSKLYSNVVFFSGPSIAYGSCFYYQDDDGYDFYKGFTEFGWYSNFDYTYKLSYDLGLGVSIYHSINKSYHIYGFQIHVYFSSAFKKNV